MRNCVLPVSCGQTAFRPRSRFRRRLIARQEYDREDLMRDGHALVVRGETFVGDIKVVVGFRTGGQLSVFWGPDPVVQFNALGQLRRLYCDGEKYAAANGRLCLLRRDASGGKLSLRRTPVSADASDRLITRVREILMSLGTTTDTGATPDPEGRWTVNDPALHGRLRRWLKKASETDHRVGIASSASV